MAAIRDVVFEMYRPRIEQIVAENVQHNVSKALTIIHLMLDDEMAKVDEHHRQGYLNVQQRMYQTFVLGNDNPSSVQNVQQDQFEQAQTQFGSTQDAQTVAVKPKQEDLADILPFKPVA